MLIKKYFVLFVLSVITTTVTANIAVLNGLTHEYKVAAGTTYKGVIILKNTSENTQQVKISLNDYLYNANGEIFYTETGNNGRTNADWIDLNTNNLLLNGLEEYELFYEITIPDNAETLIGSFWSVIIVEPIQALSSNNNADGLELKTIVRYAIQVITTINEAQATSVLAFEDVELTQIDNKRFLTVDIANQGNLYHKTLLTIELFDNKNGNEKGTFTSKKLSVLPNTSKRFYIDLSTVLKGHYSAVLLAECSTNDVFGLNIDLDVLDE